MNRLEEFLHKMNSINFGSGLWLYPEEWPEFGDDYTLMQYEGDSAKGTSVMAHIKNQGRFAVGDWKPALHPKWQPAFTWKEKLPHGGSRPGAGRPPQGDEPTISKTVTLQPADVAKLESLGEGNLSLGIRRAASKL